MFTYPKACHYVVLAIPVQGAHMRLFRPPDNQRQRSCNILLFITWTYIPPHLRTGLEVLVCDSLDWDSPLPRSLHALSAKLIGRAAMHAEPSRLGAALSQLSALEHLELVCDNDDSDDDLDLRPIVAGLQGGALTYLSLSGCGPPPSRMMCWALVLRRRCALVSRPCTQSSKCQVCSAMYCKRL